MIDAAAYSEDIRGVVFPTGASDLLLPNAAVAEVVGYQHPSTYASAPGWLLGSVGWRGLSVPLVSLALADARPVEVSRGQRARLVVCYTPSGNQALPYVAVLALGPPRLTRFNGLVLEPPEAPPENPFVLHGVTFLTRPAWIPDMDAIERAVLEAMEA